jgi:hypothetical protein
VHVRRWVDNISGLCCFASVTKHLKDAIMDGALSVQIQTHGFHKSFKFSKYKE